MRVAIFVPLLGWLPSILYYSAVAGHAAIAREPNMDRLLPYNVDGFANFTEPVQIFENLTVPFSTLLIAHPRKILSSLMRFSSQVDQNGICTPGKFDFFKQTRTLLVQSETMNLKLMKFRIFCPIFQSSLRQLSQ